VLAGVGLFTVTGVGLSASAASATSEVTIDYYNGGSYSYACVEGYTYHVGLPAEVEYVDNGCAVRVWLHQNNNNSGHSQCFDEHTLTATGSTVTWVNLNVTNNSDPC
jgi:hypothetical protein